MKRLEELCHISSGGTPSRKKPEFFGGEILWAKISDIEKAESGFIEDTEEKITEAGLANIRNKVFPKGTLLFAMYASIGKVAFAGKQMSCNQAILGINPKRNNEIYLPYLKVWFEQNKRILTQGGRGGVFKNLSATIIRNTKIDFPSYQNQIRIAEVLSKVERLISQRKESTNQLDKLLKSTFLEMFGDPGINKKGWAVKKLGEHIEYIGDIGSNGSNAIVAKNLVMLDHKEYALMVRTVNLKSNDFTKNVKYFTKETYEFFSKSKIFGGEIIMNKIGSAGEFWIMPDLKRPVSLGLNQLVIRPKKLNTLYLFHYLSTKYGKLIINSSVKGAVTKSITKTAVKELRLLYPPIEKQNEFALLAKKIDDVKKAYQKGSDELENLYSSLSQLAFKGDLDLSKLEIDHIIPVSQGGTDAEENLQVVSKRENKKISDKPITTRFGNAIMENFYEEDIAQLLKEHFGSFDFRFSEVVDFFENEKAVALNYLISEELKRNRNQIEQDIKTFIFSCVENKNSHLKLEQKFINAFEDIELKSLNPKVGRDSLLAELNSSPATIELEDISGIYFKIIS